MRLIIPLCSAAIALGCYRNSWAAGLLTHIEVEPNDTIATAQTIPPFDPFGTQTLLGAVTPGDIDYYQLTLPAPILFVANPIESLSDPYTEVMSLGLFDETGSPLIVFPQIGGFAISMTLTNPGTYFLGISGFSETPFSGLHDESFGYRLDFSYNFVPGPSSLALLGVAALVGPRRRRQR